MKDYFKQMISLNIGDTPSLKGNFSAWYLPKEDMLIYFPYSMHNKFMSEYFPIIEIIDGETKTLPPIHKDNKLTPIVQKYSKKILTNIKTRNRSTIKKLTKEDGYAQFPGKYEDFQKLGWVRINKLLHDAWMKSDDGTKHDYYNKILSFLKNETKGLNRVTLSLGGSSEDVKVKDIDSGTNQPNATIGSVRDRLFGPGNFMFDDRQKKLKFDILYEKIINENSTRH